MKSVFKNFIKNSRLIHDFSSFLVNLLPDYVEHNFSKYIEIKKCLLNLNYDQVEGDYCEFGCFTGAAINHALKTHNKFSKKNKTKNYLNRNFFGFDSFEGFPEEVHNEYQSENFISDYNFVKKLENKFDNCKIVKGYFNKTLTSEKFNTFNKIALAFIDCDIYSSSVPVFNFINTKLSNGAYVIIDDCFNLDLNGKSIYQSLTEHPHLHKNLIKITNYGLNGIVFKFLRKEINNEQTI